MQIDANKNQGFFMHLTTTSGKQMSLSMYDKQDVNYESNANGKALSMRREYGFSFEYEGSQLSEQDIKEIQEAMKEIRPSLNEFLQNSKVGELDPKNFIESAMKMANLLPTPQNENHKNAVMSNFVSTLDNLLNKNKTNDTKLNQTMLESSKELIQELLKQMQTKLEENLKKLNQTNENSTQNNTNQNNNVSLYI